MRMTGKQAVVDMCERYTKFLIHTQVKDCTQNYIYNVQTNLRTKGKGKTDPSPQMTYYSEGDFSRGYTVFINKGK